MILGGNLTADPEVTVLDGGTPRASLRLATNEKWKDGEGTKERVTFHRIVVFGAIAENCGKYLKEGSAVLVRGQIRRDKYVDRDQVERISHYVKAYQVDFLGRKPDAPAPTHVEHAAEDRADDGGDAEREMDEPDGPPYENSAEAAGHSSW